MKIKLAACAAIATATLAANAGMYQTVTVDFDDQPGGFFPPEVTDGLFSPYVTFSTEADHVLLIFSGSGTVGGSNPNNLTAAESVDASSFNSDIYMDFTDAAQNLSLDILADNDTGVIAAINVFHAGGMATVDIIGNGDFSDPINTDLSSYTDVTRIELVNITDEFGLSIDNLVFDAPVPAPGALALFAAGALCTTRRSRS
ncbi:MAG: hypothetical protein ACF8MF_06095 [Phycisphaerales bacterium JB052]